MNDGEIGLVVLIVSVILGVLLLAKKSLRKNKMLLIIPAIGIVIGVLFFVKFATTTVVEVDNTNESSQSSNCAPDELVCNQ